MGRNPERCTALALPALQRGEALGRPLTDLERVSLAVTAAKPTHHLILSTVGGGRKDLGDGFRRLVRRIERRKHRSLIYFGTAAEGFGEGGFHMHLLFWEYQDMSMYHGQTRAVGLGKPDVERIDPPEPDNVLRVVSYVLGQQEPVFGTRKHAANQPRKSYKRRFNNPHMKTLEQHRPELFVGLTLAKDKSLSDEALFESLPRFIRESTTYDFKGDLESELAQASNQSGQEVM